MIKKLIYVPMCLIFMFSAQAFTKENTKTNFWSDGEYQFSYPSTWIVVSDNDSPECQILYTSQKLANTNNIDLSEFSICKKSDTSSLGLDEAGFRQENSKWFAVGESGSDSDTTEAIKVMAKSSFLLEAKSGISCGITENSQFHQFGGGCYSAVVVSSSMLISVRSSPTSYKLFNTSNNRFVNGQRISSSIKFMNPCKW